MYFKYKVQWYDMDDNKSITKTGILYTAKEDDYCEACKKITEYFDNIEEISLAPFAPDGCLEVSAEALKAIEENVIW